MKQESDDVCKTISPPKNMSDVILAGKVILDKINEQSMIYAELFRHKVVAINVSLLEDKFPINIKKRDVEVIGHWVEEVFKASCIRIFPKSGRPIELI